MNLPPSVCVLSHFAVCCCTAQLIGAMDPIQQMLKAAGAYGHLAGTDVDIAVKSAVGMGVTVSILSGMFVGLFLDYVGQKLTALVGHALISVGLCLMFFGSTKVTVPLGCICLGLSYQCIMNSHLSVSNLFPDSMALILAVIGAASDVSLYVMPLLYSLGQHLSIKKVVTMYLMVIVGTCAIIDLLFVPTRRHSLTPNENDVENCNEQLRDSNHTSHYGSNELSRIPRGNDYKKLLFGQQIMTFHYQLFVLYFIINFFRRKNFSSNCRDMFTETTGDAVTGGKLADLFNTAVPFGFIPSVGWGCFTDKYGIVASVFLSNIFGCGVALFPMVSVVEVQYLSIALYVFLSSYLFGLLYAFLALLYGFENLASLQGLASTLAGVVSALMDMFWNLFIDNYLGGSYYKANAIVLVVSVFLFLTPIFMSLKPPPQQVLLEDTKQKSYVAFAPKSHHMFDTKTVSISGQLYDHVSLLAIGGKYKRRQI